MKASLPSHSHFFPPPSLSSLPPPPLFPSPPSSSSQPPPLLLHALSGVSTPTPLTTTKDSSTQAYWDYQFLFISQRAETSSPVSLHLTEGALPLDFPSGTYYLTGPGIFMDDHGSTVHPLDGHGYLRAFHFTKHDGAQGLQYSARYVQTEAQQEECDRETGGWRFTHRGPFSVLKKGRKLGNVKVMKNVANTSVVKWGGRLLCLWEGGVPYEIECDSLDTLGRFDVIDGEDCLVKSAVNGGLVGHGMGSGAGAGAGGVWDVAAKFLKPILHGVFNMPPKRLLSHYKIDPHRDRLLLVSCNAEDMLLPRSTFTFYEFDSSFKLLNQQTFDIPEHLMIHDWAFTDSHYILFANRIKLDIPGSVLALSGTSPMIAALSVDGSKPTSPIYLLPRFPDEVVRNRDWRIPIEAPEQMWLLHVGNAFELKDDVNGTLDIQVQATACSYQWFNFRKVFGYDWQTGKLNPSSMNAIEGEEGLLPHLVEVSMKFNNEGKCENCSVEPLNMWTTPSDFPVINPIASSRKNTYIYAATSSGSCPTMPHFPFDTVAKLNVMDKTVSTWSVGSRRFIGEPIFITKGGKEDDGYLLVVEYAVSIQRCYLVILDPKRIGEAGAVVAKFEVPKDLNFPLGFHGFWAGEDS